MVRLELQDVAVRLNLQGQPGEQPDFVVASWVLPYVYALRGDRDWRRSPQLTGSRAVSPLAVQAYKLLETGDQTIAQLKQGLGREVSESGVVRAITELWQQLRIVPVIAAPGQPAKWQLLKHRFQKAIAEGASTSQVTAISVLASIYLQAVIAASMEDVELFLSPLTARSKVREVLRGLVATRQVHTISLGHSPHFYVAGTLPEFPVANALYGGNLSAPGYYFSNFEREEHVAEPPVARPMAPPVAHGAMAQESHPEPKAESHAPRTPVRKPAAAARPAVASKSAGASRPAGARPHSRPAPHARDRKPGASRPGSASSSSRGTRHGADSRSASASGTSRWGKSSNGKSNGNHASNTGSNGARSSATGSRTAGSGSARNGKSSAPAWAKSNGHTKNGKPASKPAAGGHKAGLTRNTASGSRKPALAAGAKAGNSKRYGFTARPKPGAKKRG